MLVFSCFEEEDFLASFCIDLESKEGQTIKLCRLEKRLWVDPRRGFLSREEGI